MKSRKMYLVLVALCAVFVMQLGVVSTAHAGDPGDLALTAARSFDDQALLYQVCNNGTEPIKSITFDIDVTNAELGDSMVNYIYGGVEAGLGSFDDDTLTWTGLLQPFREEVPEDPDDDKQRECISFITSLTITGDLGDEVTSTVSIVSSIQEDDTVHVDTDTNNDTVVVDPFTIAPLADLIAEARLVTTGEIQASDVVEYQIDLFNRGPGVYKQGGVFLYSFILPPDSTVDLGSAITDLDEDDAIDVGEACFSPGVIGDGGPTIPGSTDFDGRVIVVCMLEMNVPSIPAGETRYPFSIKITAGASLASGVGDILGVLQANDFGTLKVVELNAAIIVDGVTDLSLDGLENAGADKIFWLEYDPNDLVVTINPCPGQGEVTTNGNACFRVSFSKLIYGPSFTVDDIDLGGVGSISSFTQINDFTWEVNVSGMTPGQTLTLLLGADSVQDYSAVLNNVNVLGINTVRYELPSDPSDNANNGTNQTTANGTLARTGSNLDNLWLALSILCIGAVLNSFTKKRALIK